MYSSAAKIRKDKDAEPTEFEESVAQVLFSPDTCELFSVCWFSCICKEFLKLLCPQAFFDLENTNQELKSDLKDLYINSAV